MTDEPRMVGSHYAQSVTMMNTHTTTSIDVGSDAYKANQSLAEAFDETLPTEDRERALRAAEVSAQLAKAEADKALAYAQNRATDALERRPR